MSSGADLHKACPTSQDQPLRPTCALVAEGSRSMVTSWPQGRWLVMIFTWSTASGEGHHLQFATTGRPRFISKQAAILETTKRRETRAGLHCSSSLKLAAFRQHGLVLALTGLPPRRRDVWCTVLPADRPQLASSVASSRRRPACSSTWCSTGRPLPCCSQQSHAEQG